MNIECYTSLVRLLPMRSLKKLLSQNQALRPAMSPFLLTIFFWTIFDSIVSYVTPLAMEQRGFSMTAIGIIYGTSSITGALFDFLICKFMRRADFRRIFLILFAICAVYPLILWQSASLGMFLFAMAVWGIYFDLFGFGTFDFIGRFTKHYEHASGFGLISMTRAVGDVLAPLIVGLVIATQLDVRPFALSWLFLGFGFVFLLVVIYAYRRREPYVEASPLRVSRKSFFCELHLWRVFGRPMLPVLALTFFLFVIDSFFWTLAPLFAESTDLGRLGGIFLSAYVLPSLIVGWFIGPVTRRFGKKRTAFAGMLAGTLLLSLFIFTPGSFLKILLVFAASLCMSITYPAMNAAYADYISEAAHAEPEIEGLSDFSVNLGYVIGPAMAGILADSFSIPAAFSLVGLLGAVLSVCLLFFTPSKINVNLPASCRK